jgi:signal peptidase II
MSFPTHPIALSVPAKSKPANAAAAAREIKVSPAQRALRYVVFGVLAVGGVTADLFTKHRVFAARGWEQFGQVHWIVDGYFGIETSVNHGALFGLGSGYTSGFVLLSFVALLAISYFVLFRSAALDLALTSALGLVTGGILGNLYDRLGLWHAADTPGFVKYGVRDWILFRYEHFWLTNPWPNFNIADCCLVVGATLLALHSFFSDSSGPQRESTDDAGTTSPTP